jgi:hypothetical protein
MLPHVWYATGMPAEKADKYSRKLTGDSFQTLAPFLCADLRQMTSCTKWVY